MEGFKVGGVELSVDSGKMERRQAERVMEHYSVKVDEK